MRGPSSTFTLTTLLRYYAEWALMGLLRNYERLSGPSFQALDQNEKTSVNQPVTKIDKDAALKIIEEYR